MWVTCCRPLNAALVQFWQYLPGGCSVIYFMAGNLYILYISMYVNGKVYNGTGQDDGLASCSLPPKKTQTEDHTEEKGNASSNIM